MVERKGRNGGTLKSQEPGDPGLTGAGRPKGSRTLSTKFQKFLEGETEWKVNGETVRLTREEALMFRLMEIAKSGTATQYGENNAPSVAAIKEIYDRTFGKPPQEVKVETETKGVVRLPDGTELEW